MNFVSRFLAVVIGLFVCHAARADERPNIVFVIADDCTFRDLGCYGGQAYTPHIDHLADQGMRFTRCFQAAPMCSPTRHNIYTGLYPVRSGAYPNHTFVEKETKSVVQYLKPLGYRVAHSGKSHVSPASVFAWEKIPGSKNPEFDQVETFVADCCKNDDPFCLLLCSNEPHTPWDKGDRTRYPEDKIKLPPYFVDTPKTRSGMSRYLAEITYFDSQVGQAIDLIDKYQLGENTLFVVVSEQGSSMPFAKWTCYDNGLQSGCVVRWPGKVDAGSVNDAMIEYVDFLPTFIEVAGGESSEKLDGESLVSVLAGKQTHKQFVYGEMTTRGINNGSDAFGIRSVRSERFKLIWNFTPEVPFQNACTKSVEFRSWVDAAESGDAKAASLVNRYKHRPEYELYDVVQDPLEMNNLVGDESLVETQRALRSELLRWMDHCGDRGQATELDAGKHQGRGRQKKAGKGKKGKMKSKQ